MRTFEQLAQSAYAAYCKQMGFEARTDWVPELAAWRDLPPAERSAWLASAKQLWAEFAAIH